GVRLTACYQSNSRPEMTMNNIFVTASVPDVAGLAAALAKLDGPQRVYIVEPIGAFEDDTNVTDKKFPGNPTRSYRSRDPLRIVGEVKEWRRLTAEEIQDWRDRIARLDGEILN